MPEANLPLISVIVPIYNVSKYLKKSIESITNQTYKNLEILLVNDGSTDDSEKICLEKANMDKRISYFYKENGGLSDARNYGIDRCNGKYLCFIDSDDYLDSNYVESLYKSIIENNSSISMCTFNIVNENGRFVSKEEFLKPSECVNGQEILNRVLEPDGYKYVVAWNKLIERNTLADLRFPKGKLYEDEFINYKLLWKVQRVSLVNIPLYFYVQRNGSIKASIDLSKIKMQREMHLDRLNFYESHHSVLFNKAAQMYCNWIVETMRKSSQLIDSDYKKILQNDFRKYMKYCNNRRMAIRAQNLIGFLNIGIAGKIKRVVIK